MASAARVVWCQASHHNVRWSVDELRWRTVTENPLVSQLLTLSQFSLKCRDEPHLINDIVFNGTFASQVDYQIFQTLIVGLPKIKRLSIVNTPPALLQFTPRASTLLNLFHLTDLAIRSCHMYQLPFMIRMCSVPQLRTVDLSNNCLPSLDSCINLQQSFHLEVINISRNQLSEFPAQLRLMVNLENLNISSNRLRQLCEDDFQQLARLTVLDISNNPEITTLPTTLVELPALRRLILTGLLSLTQPRYELAKKGLETIKKYYADKAKKGWLESTASRAVSTLG